MFGLEHDLLPRRLLSTVMLAILAFAVRAEDIPAQGLYLRQGDLKNTSAELFLHRIEGGSAEISVSVTARAAGSTLARTGSIEHHLMALRGMEAVYEEAPGQGTGCRITMKFSARVVIVKQVGLCADFGVGIDASGRYQLRHQARRP